MKSTTSEQLSLRRRIGKFTIVLGALLLFVYAFLPLLTETTPVLNRMSRYLDENGIDPSRYYYTDVEQVKEAEQHLESVLKSD